MSDQHDGHGIRHSHSHATSSPALRTRAIESLLLEKGLLSTDVVDRIVDKFENDIGPMNGARMVAKAWVDPAYRERMLKDGTAAMHELGIESSEDFHLVVLENTPTVHNAVVCTLCSCYPWWVLGLPPAWYKQHPYRSRMVSEPREVLKEFGVQLDPSMEVRVWDSSSEVRFMVLPERPAGTEGMSEEELAALVTRESMIGVARLESPVAAGAGR
jgi:nitrile hydratase